MAHQICSGEASMKFFRVKIEGDPNRTPQYRRTLSQAHALARNHYKPWWDTVVIEEVSVLSDKIGFESLLCMGAPIVEASTRSWGISNRGGLKEHL
jgi:uridine phosphorylase